MQPLKNFDRTETAAPTAGLREDDNDDSDEDYGLEGSAPYEQAISTTLILDKLPAQIMLDITKIPTPRAFTFYASAHLFPLAGYYFRLQDAGRRLPDIAIFTDHVLDLLSAWNVLHPDDLITSDEFFELLTIARQTIVHDDNRTEANCYG